jgi:hypothetical protein
MRLAFRVTGVPVLVSAPHSHEPATAYDRTRLGLSSRWARFERPRTPSVPLCAARRQPIRHRDIGGLPTLWSRPNVPGDIQLCSRHCSVVVRLLPPIRYRRQRDGNSGNAPGEASGQLHEENSAKVEKRCFADSRAVVSIAVPRWSCIRSVLLSAGPAKRWRHCQMRENSAPPCGRGPRSSTPESGPHHIG